MTVNSSTTDLSWLLDDLVARVVGAERAVVLSGDGLPISRSRNLSAEDAEHLSAVASGFQSLARGSSRHFGCGRVRQTVVEMERNVLVVTAAGQGACLALLATEDADLGIIVYEMNLLVRQVGSVLTSAPRSSRTHLAGDPGAS
ncbi:MAG: roadblock/LC7 domain-containing protein [Actinomycetales bacterium]|nr:roadblock/LC7 domain-containing protein [Actinomycetales bacterium]